MNTPNVDYMKFYICTCTLFEFQGFQLVPTSVLETSSSITSPPALVPNINTSLNSSSLSSEDPAEITMDMDASNVNAFAVDRATPMLTQNIAMLPRSGTVVNQDYFLPRRLRWDDEEDGDDEVFSFNDNNDMPEQFRRC